MFTARNSRSRVLMESDPAVGYNAGIGGAGMNLGTEGADAS